MSIFRHLAGSVHAKHIQCALGPTVQANQSIEDAWELLMTEADGYDPLSRISLVLAGDRPVGYVGFDSLDSSLKDVASVAEPIPADGLVSADTPVLEIAKLFSKESRHFYFVLQESQITGTIHYEDLLGPQFKLCLFALTLELETTALDLALKDPAASWSVLSEGRKRKAMLAYNERYSRDPDAERLPIDQLLGCTLFIDKGKILRKRRMIAGGPNEIDSLFGKADRVRNSCAHTDPDKEFVHLLLDRASMQGFIAKTEGMIASMRRQLRSLAGK
jgi:hypothetical protein